MQNQENLKYPIGTFVKPLSITENHIKVWILEIELFSDKIKLVTNALQENQLNYCYRENGWTIKQVVHHCADSHLHASIRMKLAQTQVLPVINPYNEALWANLIDANHNVIAPSIAIIDGLHKRWSLFLKNLNSQDLKREFYHPESNENVSIETAIGLYAWHCNHHLAHINLALLNEGNF